MSAWPRRGEVWLVDFSPARGSERDGLRPAVVIQNDVGTQYAATTIVAAITTTIKPYPVTVVVEKGEGGLPRRSMVNLAQLLTLDKSRLRRLLGALSEERMRMIEHAIRVSLDLQSPA
jgi:mRNA interferase MazF